MKKLLSIAMAVAFVGGLVGAAAASGTATTTDKKADDKKMEKSAEKKPAEKKPATKTANGTVKSASADGIVVAGKDKGKDAEWTFGVDAKTRVTRAGKTITTKDLAAGDVVDVRYTEHEGKAMATAITVKPGASKKVEAPKDEKKK